MAGPTGNESSHIFDGVTIRGGLALEGGGGSTYLNRDVAAHLARQIAVMRAQGYFAETFTRAGQFTGTAATSGTVYYTPIGLVAGDVVSSFTSQPNTGGSVLTLAKVGLYQPTTAGAATLLCSTASDHTNYQSAGVRTTLVTSPYTVLADGGYFIGGLWVGTTGPTLQRCGLAVVSAALAGGVMGGAGIQAAQADLPATASITYSVSNQVHWWAVS